MPYIPLDDYESRNIDKLEREEQLFFSKSHALHGSFLVASSAILALSFALQPVGTRNCCIIYSLRCTALFLNGLQSLVNITALYTLLKIHNLKIRKLREALRDTDFPTERVYEYVPKWVGRLYSVCELASFVLFAILTIVLTLYGLIVSYC